MLPSALAVAAPEPPLLQELQALQRFFDESTQGLREGRVADLAGVDRRVSAVCRAVQAAEPEMQETCLPELTLLIDKLNLYETELRGLQSLLLDPQPPAEGGHGGP